MSSPSLHAIPPSDSVSDAGCSQCVGSQQVATVTALGVERSPLLRAAGCAQIGTLTLRKLRDLEKESGMTGSKDGAKKAGPAEDAGVRDKTLREP